MILILKKLNIQDFQKLESYNKKKQFNFSKALYTKNNLNNFFKLHPEIQSRAAPDRVLTNKYTYWSSSNMHINCDDWNSSFK